MTVLLTQYLPGYQTDVIEKGGVRSTMFDKFTSLFSPAVADMSGGYLISRVILFSIVAAGFIFFLKLVSSGFSYLTSGGNPEKIQSASKDLVNATIGLVVTISAYFLAQIIQVVFGIKFL